MAAHICQRLDWVNDKAWLGGIVDDVPLDGDGSGAVGSLDRYLVHLFIGKGNCLLEGAVDDIRGIGISVASDGDCRLPCAGYGSLEGYGVLPGDAVLRRIDDCHSGSLLLEQNSPLQCGRFAESVGGSNLDGIETGGEVGCGTEAVAGHGSRLQLVAVYLH